VHPGLHEDLDITNYARRPVSVSLVLELDSDFADPEETKGERKQEGRIERSWTRDGDDAWMLCHDYRASRRVQRKGERGTLSIHRALRMRIMHASSPPVRPWPPSPGRTPFTATTRLVNDMTGLSGNVDASGGGTMPYRSRPGLTRSYHTRESRRNAALFDA